MRDQRAEVSLSISPEKDIESEPADPREFRILVVGDFSGRGDGAPAADDSPRRVDRDDIDAHVARIAPRLDVDVAGTDIHLAFASLDDFHPDRLVARLNALQRSPAHSAPIPTASRPRETSATQADIARAVSGGSLLDDMLEQVSGPAAASPQATAQPRRSDELSAFIDRAVAPHLIHRDEHAEQHAASERDAMAALLRGVLHHPRVQALESTWRALDLLVRRLDTDGDLRLFMLDRPRTRVASSLEQLVQRQSASDPERWALVIALHAFDEGNAGAESLAHIAMAAKGLDTPVVAAAPASFTGADSLAALDDDEREPSPAPDIYDLIRHSADGRFLGLTYPRVLMRTPYGRDNPCDTIEFEEMQDPNRHSDYLWGSGAALVALLVGEAFTQNGWAIAGRLPLDVGGLPYFTYQRGPETVAKSCAEGVMSERVARALLARGLMPVAWIRDSDRIRVVELRSVSDPTSPLAASWAGTWRST